MPEKKKTNVPQPSPQQNFYLHVNHQWLMDNAIPSSESRWGTFDILNHQTLERLQGICEDSQKSNNAKKGSNVQLVRDYYLSGMDMETRNRQGMDPIKDLLSQIDQITQKKDVVKIVAEHHLSQIASFFNVFIEEDFKKADSNAFFIAQGGLGMPDRDYYLKDDKTMQKIREEYKKYIANMFQLSGIEKDKAETSAQAVFKLEHALAEASIPAQEAREVDKNYHKFTKEQAKTELAQVDWDTYFEKLGVPAIKDFVIMQPGFIKKVGDILQHSDIQDIKQYLTFTVLNHTGSMLSDEFVSESFTFNGQILQGLKEPKPLWKRTIQRMHAGPLTQAIGPLYCEQYFNNEDKTRVMQMVAHIKESFGKRVKDLDWMTEETKKLTLQKLDNITFKMGYPDKWIDVSGIDIQPDSYALNNLRLAEFESRRKLKQLDEPFDRTEWLMPPTLVNACSDLKREMTFPAAILQPPFFDSSADEAYNYGAIGMVVGHELTHFFDDQGCKFDIQGNMNDWWSDEDREHFKQKSGKFVEHFAKYKANGLQVNAQLTLGENIADVAGMAIAYEAFQRYLEESTTTPLINGTTPEQRFFIGYAKVWAGKITPEKAQEQALTDPHSPGEVRVNAVLSITPPFLKAFAVKEGDTMYTSPQDRPKLW